MGDESDDVPRVPAGNPNGGQWTTKDVRKRIDDAREGRSKLDALLKRIGKPDGGFTYQPMLDSEPREGFVVAMYPERGSLPKPWKDIKFKDLVEHMLRNRDLLRNPANHLGAWHDPETGLVHLDISRVTRDRGEVERLARKHDQIAYWDIAAGRSIDVMRKG